MGISFCSPLPITLLIMVQAHLFAHGRVQGVGFRYTVHRYATKLGLNGWVRNLHDERVEILAQGSQDDIQKLISYLKGNPGLSYVVKLDIIWEKPSKVFSNFHIEF